ncbi:unnamed protein product [Parnassius mnemosyne]|uniref:Kazal-like domain-containing protein n=1 Tax=Parnassius mnemosyne TaxID=213953 RepID=A0AAV1L6Q6_9NEOP
MINFVTKSPGIAVSYTLCFAYVFSPTTNLFSNVGIRESILGKKSFYPSTYNPMNSGCKCSTIYDPVCASNNKSYYNPCYIKCESGNNTIKVKYFGKCLPF